MKVPTNNDFEMSEVDTLKLRNSELKNELIGIQFAGSLP